MNIFGDQTTQQTLTQTKPVQSVLPTVVFSDPDQHNSYMLLKSLPVTDISTFGQESANKVAELSQQITTKVKASDSGEFGTGINNILGLMSTVDIKSLGQPKKTGLIGKFKSFVSNIKTEFTEQFTDVSTKVKGIATQLDAGIVRMADEANWMTQMYDANIAQLRDLENKHQVISVLCKEEQDKLQAMTDPLEIQDQKLYVDRLEKHQDKLLRLVSLCQITAPEIRMMQASNYNNAQKFKDLIHVTIPSWEKTISLGLLSLRQKADAELAKGIDDASNDFMKQAASMVASNMVATAQNAQRSVVDISTLEHMHTELITALQQTKQIEEQGRQDRKAAAVKVQQLEDNLRQELSKV